MNVRYYTKIMTDNKPDTNLYEETEKTLSRNDKSWDDVEFISIGKDYLPRYLGEEPLFFFIPIEDFIEYSKNVDYYSGHGSAEINTSLKIVGDDWWLERHEYDGAENWVYKEKPKKPKDELSIAKELLKDSEYRIHI